MLLEQEQGKPQSTLEALVGLLGKEVLRRKEEQACSGGTGANHEDFTRTLLLRHSKLSRCQ